MFKNNCVLLSKHIYILKTNKKQPKLIESNLERILELIRIDKRRGTNKSLTTALVEEQRTSFLYFFRNKLDNKLKKKYWFNILGKDFDLDFKGLDDEIILKLISELYLLKDGKHMFTFKNYAKYIIDFHKSLPID